MAANLKVSRIQKRGQVTIPMEIRQKLHLEEGDLVAFIETQDGVVLSPQQVVPAAPRTQAGRRAIATSGALEEVFTFAERLAQGKLGDQPVPAAPEEPSMVEQTAGIFRQRQAGEPGEIDFAQARQAFIEHLARQAADEAKDS